MATSLSTTGSPPDSVGTSEPKTQMASRSVQPFLHSSPQNVPIGQLYNRMPISPSKLPLTMGGSGPPSNTWFPGATRVLNPKQPTDHATLSATKGCIKICSTVMWPNNTSGQSNLRTHRCRRRIRQMAPRALPYGHVGATWQIWLNLGFLPPTRVHNPNGKSIGSAISAQLTAESPYTLQWATLSRKIPPSNGRIWLPSSTGFLGPL